MTVSKAVNPYAVGRKTKTGVVPAVKKTLATASAKSGSTIIDPKKKLPKKNSKVIAPPAAATATAIEARRRPAITTLAAAASLANNKLPVGTVPRLVSKPALGLPTVTAVKMAPAANAVAVSKLAPVVHVHHQQQHKPTSSTSTTSSLSLKQKLKRDIENLKRAKLLQKQRLAEQKRQKVQDKLNKRNKQHAELQQKMAAATTEAVVVAAAAALHAPRPPVLVHAAMQPSMVVVPPQQQQQQPMQFRNHPSPYNNGNNNSQQQQQQPYHTGAIMTPCYNNMAVPLPQWNHSNNSMLLPFPTPMASAQLPPTLLEMMQTVTPSPANTRAATTTSVEQNVVPVATTSKAVVQFSPNAAAPAPAITSIQATQHGGSESSTTVTTTATAALKSTLEQATKLVVVPDSKANLSVVVPTTKTMQATPAEANNVPKVQTGPLPTVTTALKAQGATSSADTLLGRLGPIQLATARLQASATMTLQSATTAHAMVPQVQTFSQPSMYPVSAAAAAARLQAQLQQQQQYPLGKMAQLPAYPYPATTTNYGQQFRQQFSSSSSNNSAAYSGFAAQQLQLQQLQQQQRSMQQQQQVYRSQAANNYQPQVAHGLAPRFYAQSNPNIIAKPKTKHDMGFELLADALEHPSPFAQTHKILPFVVTIVKKPGESFGVTVKTEMESALVEQEWLDKLPGAAVKAGKSSPFKADPSAAKAKGTIDANVASDKSESPAAIVPLQDVKGKPESAFVSAVSVVGGSEKGADTPPLEGKVAKPRKARRRRVFFAAMSVVDPTKQNQRSSSSTMQLKPGDLVLQINGTKTAGLGFKEACALFAGCNTVGKDGIVHCELVVARRKVMPSKVAVPLSLSTGPLSLATKGPDAAEFRYGPLTAPEAVAFGGSMLAAIFDSKRLLGRPIADELVQSLTLGEATLSGRTFPTLKDAWSNVSFQLEFLMAERSLQYWKDQWQKEPSEVQLSGSEFLTDAQRSSLRAAPRPLKGCKCGKIDHEYVNDRRCPLYSDMRAVDPSADELMVALGPGSKRALSKLPRDLNTVETAFKDRFLRQQEEKESQEAEARFVDRMEEAQVTKLSKAVFAPSLTAIVLSAVVELQKEFKDDKQLVRAPPKPVAEVVSKPVPAANPTAGDSSDDSDDEDVPLAALRKQPPTKSSVDVSNKKRRMDTSVRRKFLTKLALSISKKWGHVYTEPPDMEYAWRWEVYHGQTSESSSRWEANFKNPRTPGTLTYEKTRFVIDDTVVLCVEGDDPAPGNVDALKVLLHAVSPSQSGICDELLALIRMGVLRINQYGVPVLARGWFANVDVLLLDDMLENWGVDADTKGKYGVVDSVRISLNRHWTKTEQGWALDEDDIVYEDSEFDAWRGAFEDKQQTQTDRIDGVGRFGI